MFESALGDALKKTDKPWDDAMSGLKEIAFDSLFNYGIQTANLPGDARVSFAKYLIDAAVDLMVNTKDANFNIVRKNNERF